MRIRTMLVGGCLLLAGCGGGGGGEQAGPVAGNAATATAAPERPPILPPPAMTWPTDAWVGKWVGVEGLVLDIAYAERAGAKGDGPGRYRLHIALMDSAGDYSGTADGNMIRFTRDGVAETIRHTDGAATGLKWLAGKTDCLTIKPGEGFCRG